LADRAVLVWTWVHTACQCECRLLVHILRLVPRYTPRVSAGRAKCSGCVPAITSHHMDRVVALTQEVRGRMNPKEGLQTLRALARRSFVTDNIIVYGGASDGLWERDCRVRGSGGCVARDNERRTEVEGVWARPRSRPISGSLAQQYLCSAHTGDGILQHLLEHFPAIV
jgi:hypothetical protein